MKVPDGFERQLSAWGLDIGVEGERLLLAYAHLLSRYERANVIGTRDVEEILSRHVLDSLSCLLFAPLYEAKRVADIGSGGGLPGMPLAIALPSTGVTLFEATGKKVAFLREASNELGLANVKVVNARVEESAREEVHRGSYDVCTVRALARLSVIAEYSLPLLRRGGTVVAMKGRVDAEERAEGDRASGKLGGRVREEMQVHYLPGVEQGERRLLLLEKIGETPEAYPRRTGVPVRNPLGAR
jgi:16S rRNA (guanine527-N7)-methyltransferase